MQADTDLLAPSSVKSGHGEPMPGPR